MTPNLQSVNESASTVIEALTQCLAEKQTTDKAPPGLDKALESLSSDPISCVFLDAGFWAWYAYFVATDRVEGLKESASQLSSSTLEHVAAEVSKVNAHASLTRRIQHVFFHSDRSPKRCRLLRSNNVEPPSLPESVSPDLNPRPPKRSRLERVQQSPSPQPDATKFLDLHFMNRDIMIQEEVSDALPHRGASRQDTGLARPNETCKLPAFDINPQYQYAWPKAKNLPFVFPHYMCTIIVKSGDDASIMLSFPSDPTLCRLVLDISATAVQHLAKELFDAHIRDENGRRCVVLEHGTTMDINSSMTLRGATGVPLDKLFGQMVGQAIRLSPQRMEELSMGELLSKCVFMEVWGAADRPGRLNFIVNADNLSLVFHQLWNA